MSAAPPGQVYVAQPAPQGSSPAAVAIPTAYDPAQPISLGAPPAASSPASKEKKPSLWNRMWSRSPSNKAMTNNSSSPRLTMPPGQSAGAGVGAGAGAGVEAGLQPLSVDAGQSGVLSTQTFAGGAPAAAGQDAAAQQQLYEQQLLAQQQQQLAQQQLAAQQQAYLEQQQLAAQQQALADQMAAQQQAQAQAQAQQQQQLAAHEPTIQPTHQPAYLPGAGSASPPSSPSKSGGKPHPASQFLHVPLTLSESKTLLQNGFSFTAFFDHHQDHEDISVKLPVLVFYHEIRPNALGNLHFCLPNERVADPGSCIVLQHLTAVFLGKQTDVFRAEVAKHAHPSRCVSLITSDQTQLNLEGTSAEELTVFMACLNKLLTHHDKYKTTAEDGTIAAGEIPVSSGESKLDHISTAQEMARKAEQLEHSGHAATPESGSPVRVGASRLPKQRQLTAEEQAKRLVQRMGERHVRELARHRIAGDRKEKVKDGKLKAAARAHDITVKRKTVDAPPSESKDPLISVSLRSAVSVHQLKTASAPVIAYHTQSQKKLLSQKRELAASKVREEEQKQAQQQAAAAARASLSQTSPARMYFGAGSPPKSARPPGSPVHTLQGGKTGAGAGAAGSPEAGSPVASLASTSPAAVGSPTAPLSAARPSSASPSRAKASSPSARSPQQKQQRPGSAARAGSARSPSARSPAARSPAATAGAGFEI